MLEMQVVPVKVKQEILDQLVGTPEVTED